MARVFVTVGMARQPFDRLVAALEPMCRDHDVFAQIGSSTVRPPCPNARYVPYDEVLRRIREADVVVAQAGNTVRLVQRAGKVPIALARTVARGEAGNDHQVEYLRAEERRGRVIALWDVTNLATVVAAHPRLEAELLATRPPPRSLAPQEVGDRMEALVATVVDDPFRDHYLRRYSFAWRALAGREGDHLDLGCGKGFFTSVLEETSSLRCVGADPHGGYLAGFRRRRPQARLVRIETHAPLPFADRTFDSVSMLDSLEHVPNERAMLAEVARVIRPGGLLVLSVPARYAFSALDPDNVKFVAPTLHRLVYTARFGRATYSRRFGDLGDNLCGDMSVGKGRHSHYDEEELERLLQPVGFEIVRMRRANLFFQVLQILSILGPRPLRGMLNRAILLDADLFSQANLFVLARRSER